MVTKKTHSIKKGAKTPKTHMKNASNARKAQSLSKEKSSELAKKEFEGYGKLETEKKSHREPGRSIESRWEEGDDFDQERGF